MDYSTLSDLQIIRQIGDFVKAERVQQQKSQEQLSKEAGISRSTLSLLERGEKVNLITLIQVLRVLDRLQWLEAFEVKKTISPMEYIKLQKKYDRQRVRNSDMAADNPPLEW
ncbi:helix-turn-helix transcriptional regulator [Algoriphagus halophytocola]|uniref:Helix-turn-helix transcriptional regulator n=1 Tax=Algoriphagus halophytocola TaxID=2991499 RepID=A0ABY6MN27_9BACT|nr:MULTISPECIES: helix-turn-helix transcriptional regulator [unclassified Algoriphagus]UZD24091.1 helix-turn-helix transcriptional regulator [Algoriphagus sp. TR-M5]WBL41462.1 helix-turn-helix transcriptional regulator [Algoriphagus sp. TR-M9]